MFDENEPHDGLLFSIDLRFHHQLLHRLFFAKQKSDANQIQVITLIGRFKEYWRG